MSLQYATIVFEGCDFTDFGTNQIVASAGSTPRVQYTFKDCKANSAAVWGGSVASPIGPTVDYIRCGVNNYTSGRFWYQGTQSTETTIILTGGASDGTTPISWKVATTSVNSWFSPFEFIPISIWNDTTGSPKTVTINAVRSTSGLPNTDDIWIVAEYMGTSGNPNGSFATNTKASGLDAGVAYSASGASWAGSPSGTPFAMSVTITPQNKGPITVYVKAGAASSTFYVDPKIIVT